jgi:hypothetical protein
LNPLNTFYRTFSNQTIRENCAGAPTRQAPVLNSPVIPPADACDSPKIRASAIQKTGEHYDKESYSCAEETSGTGSHVASSSVKNQIPAEPKGKISSANGGRIVRDSPFVPPNPHPDIAPIFSLRETLIRLIVLLGGGQIESASAEYVLFYSPAGHLISESYANLIQYGASLIRTHCAVADELGDEPVLIDGQIFPSEFERRRS